MIVDGLRKAVILLVLALPATSASAQFMGILCHEPSTPYCINSYTDFSSDYEFERCKREVLDFVRGLNEWAECIATEATETASDKADRVVKKFNCKARGEPICF